MDSDDSQPLELSYPGNMETNESEDSIGQNKNGQIQNNELIIPARPCLTKKNKISLASTCLAIFLYTTAGFPAINVLDQYVSRSLSVKYNMTNTQMNRKDCLSGNNSWYTERQNKIQSEAAQQMIIVNLAGLVPQFLITFLLGPCSDQIGRKLALLLPPIGGCLSSMVYLLVIHYNLPYYYMCIGMFIEAWSGGTSLFFTACVASVADNTTLEKRSFWICILDITMCMATVVTNISSGYIIEYLGFQWNFVVIGCTFALCVVTVFLTVQENVRESSDVKIFTLEHFKRTARIYTKDNGTNRRWKLGVLLVIVIFINL